jgi:hypothetical protein
MKKLFAEEITLAITFANMPEFVQGANAFKGVLPRKLNK